MIEIGENLQTVLIALIIFGSIVIIEMRSESNKED